jgi:hypothetical protein
VLRTPAERVDPAPDDRRPGVTLEKRRVAEPVEPAVEAFQPFRVGGQCVHRDEARDHVHVPRRGRVPPGVVDGAVHLAPRRGPAVERRDELGLAPSELGAKRLAEEMVVSVPTAVPVERNDEQRRLLECLEPRRGIPHPAHDDVAQRSAHRLEDRRSGQEADVGVIELGEVLEPEVVRHEPVLAGELGHGAAMFRPVAEDEPGEMQAGRPSLRALPELRGVRLVELRTDDAEEQLRVAPAERQLPDAHLEHLALGA